MNVKIITDSASNMLALDGVPFASVPLSILIPAERCLSWIPILPVRK